MQICLLRFLETFYRICLDLLNRGQNRNPAAKIYVNKNK